MSMAHRTSCGWYDDGWEDGVTVRVRFGGIANIPDTNAYTSLLGLAPTLPRNVLLLAFAPATANADMHVFVACKWALCAVSCSNRCLPMGPRRRSLLHSLLADGLCAPFVAPFVSGRWAQCAVRCSIRCLPMGSPRRSLLHSLHVDGLCAAFVAPFVTPWVACNWAPLGVARHNPVTPRNPSTPSSTMTMTHRTSWGWYDDGWDRGKHTWHKWKVAKPSRACQGPANHCACAGRARIKYRIFRRCDSFNR